ncbi:alpha/beta hydrolase [Starkeya sp. ORNL1]|nr:alpha/beta hydrolase [Starkeya sp. ORNL1]
MPRKTVRTAMADIAVLESSGTGMPVLLIHGNSSCKEVFLRQLESPAATRYRMIAMDLPGHGDSTDATDERAYTIPGYAETALNVLEAMGASNAAVLGWSLGGHVGLEMLARRPNLKGLMIVGAPPYAHGFLGMMRAFQVNLSLLLATRAKLSLMEARRFARTSLGAAYDPIFLDVVRRTDVRARPALYRGMMRADGADQKQIAEHASAPIAVLNGSEEPFARLDYLAELAYGDLWDGQCHVIEGAGHAPFLERPGAFNPIFERFLDELAARKARTVPERVAHSA